jgi:hypothetical protein
MTLEVEGDGIGEAALRYAWHGWPIAPGVEPNPCPRNGWPVPLTAALPYHGPMSTNDVERYWHHHRHPVLLAAGLTIDVVEVRQSFGAELLQRSGQHGPVAVLPDGQWLFFVEVGTPPSDELLDRNVRHYGAGSWVPLPPTPIGEYPITWHTDPASAGWRPFRRTWFGGELHPVPPSRHRPTQHRAQPSQPRPRLRHAGQPRSPEPPPRHHTQLVASNRATFQVTYPNQEPGSWANNPR